MMWKYFLEYNQLDLFDMWKHWIPERNNNSEEQNANSKIYYVENKEWDGEYFEDEFFELIDPGNRVTSFEHFVCFAYDNSIP